MIYEEVTIKDVCKIKSGKRLPTGANFAEEATDFPYIRARDIKAGTINGSNLVYLTEEVHKKIQRYIVNAGDIVITIVGASVGDVGYVKKEFDGFNLTENAVRLTDFDERINSQYLFYILNSRKYWELMQQIAGGSAQPKLGIYKVESIPLKLPPINVQKRLVNILSIYDNLIENNQKQIKLLEEAAQRLYKEWFVDFRFPGYEDVTIIDGVPEGWRVGTIAEIVEYHDKIRKPLSSMQRAAFKGEYRYYGAAGILDYVEKYLFDGTYLLFGEDGSVVTTAGTPVLQYVTGKFWVNNHAHVLTGKPPFTTEFIYMLFRKMGVSDIITGVAQPKISQARLSAKKVLIPSSKEVLEYQNIVSNFFDRILVLEKQIEITRQARDSLLPKLINGELEV